jgi:hypothetical protein
LCCGKVKKKTIYCPPFYRRKNGGTKTAKLPKKEKIQNKIRPESMLLND